MMRIDNTTLKARVKDIEDALREEQLEALVLYANGSMLGSFNKMHGYLRYLCNFDGHNTPAMLVLRPGHEPSLISAANPFLVRIQHHKLLWFSDVRTTKAPLMGDEIVSILKKPNTQGRRIGYMGLNETPVPVWTAINKGISGVEWVDFGPTFDKRRVQKTDLQMAFHRRAAEICDAIFQTVRREVRTGLKAYELQAEMERTARREGAEYCVTWLTVEPRADYPRFYKEECTRVPMEGDQVIPGIYMTYDGHWGHAIRTGTIGQPTDDHKRIYDIVREMHQACLDRLKPGENLFDAVEAMDKVLYNYYSEEQSDRSRAGHGLGLSYEDPIVSGAFFHPWEFKNKPHGANQLEIKPGMLLEVHPNLFIPGVAGAMVGDMVAITDTGYEVLTEFPPDLIIW